MPSLKALFSNKPKDDLNDRENLIDDPNGRRLNIICIPDDGSPIYITRVKLCVDTLEVTLFRGPLDVIKGFMSVAHGEQPVPNLVACADWNKKDWKSRTLVDLENMDPDKPIAPGSKNCLGPYLMYKSSRRGAPRNKHFKGLENIDPVRGSVYIFKAVMAPDDYHSSTHEDLDESFIESAFGGKGISNAESLRWLALQKGLK